jgi:hypothetical protein
LPIDSIPVVIMPRDKRTQYTVTESRDIFLTVQLYLQLYSFATGPNIMEIKVTGE